MNTKLRQMKATVLTTAVLAAAVGGYYITQSVKAQSGPPRVVVDGVSYIPVPARAQRLGYDTCLKVKVHCEGHISESQNRKCVGGDCSIDHLRLVFVQGSQERIADLPPEKQISGAFTSGGPTGSYFTVWLALNSLPVTSKPFVLKAEMSMTIVYNIYKDGKAVSGTFTTSGATPFSYTVRGESF
jgi:hypothetical protein